MMDQRNARIALFLTFISLNCIYLSHGASQEHWTNYEDLYEKGMEAYREGKWTKCTKFFNGAIKAYKFYQNTVIDCRLKCQKEMAQPADSSLENVFDEILRASNCLRRCRKLKMGQMPNFEASYVTDKKFEDRSPYNYLQFCYFKQDKLKEAAAAAFTYYITHQEDKPIQETLQYYRSMAAVDREDFVDLERKEYQISYITALEAYNDEDWATATVHFEAALAQYYTEEERCRANCEKGFTHNDFPDFINAIGDHYVAVIVCKQKCLQKLSKFGMQQLDNFVADHYNYLQYAYYESRNLEKAFESIANYLLFRPSDQEMLANKDYYMKTLRHKEKEFKPSQEVVDYVRMWSTIDKSLDFVRESYTLPRDSIEPETDDSKPDPVEVDKRSSLMQSFSKIGINVLEEFQHLISGPRFAVDGVIREDQCQAIADLAKSQEPDDVGVRQVDVLNAMTIVKSDQDYEVSLRLMLRASEMMKVFTYVYLNHSRLYIQNSKVVCRLPGEHWQDKLGSDCIPQEDGTCMGTSVAPEYRVIAFLTDISDGSGQFHFLDENEKTQFSVSPRCGLMVGFAGGVSHAMKLAEKEERCALVVSLTADKAKLNPDVKDAKDLLLELEKEHVKHMQKEDKEEILTMFYSQGVNITQTGEDLLGRERFAADGLATQDECTKLITLAKREAISGDGYHGNAFPHSEGEIFTGLSVNSVEKLIDMDDATVYPLQLLLDLSDHSRLLVEKYFNLTKPLYFDYTHLVCRTAIEGQEREAEDLSHPVHSDNCMIQPDGSCIPDRMAYIQRHYSAILYLNDDFEGGQFFFAHRNKSEQISVKPRCGRLVAFNAGEYHGVKSVRKGQRCAIAMWYTHDPNHIEVARLHAQRRLDALLKDKIAATRVSNELNDAIPPEPFLEDTDHDEL